MALTSPDQQGVIRETGRGDLVDPEEFPHDCEPATLEDETRSSGARQRVSGVDAARGIALIGMVAVHTVVSATESGDVTLAWQLASGTSSALFAVLGGVGLAFMTGRTSPPQGSQWRRLAVIPVVRGIILGIAGLLLGLAVATEDANVILPYLGAMFILSALLLPLRARTLVALGLGWAVVSPVLSHLIRANLTVTPPVNLTFGEVWRDPGTALLTVFLTGFFPALTWMSYIALGMGLGRMRLASRPVIVRILGGGIALAIFASLAATLFVQVGARDRLAAAVQGHTPFELFTDYLVWGGSGALPADSWWWLTVNSRHSGTPLDLLYTSGIALLVIGACLAIDGVFRGKLALLAIPGSMTLTLYSMHLLLLQPLSGLSDLAHFAVQVIVLTAFAVLWSRRFRRGPLEWLLWKATTLFTPRPPARHRAARAARAG